MVYIIWFDIGVDFWILGNENKIKFLNNLKNWIFLLFFKLFFGFLFELLFKSVVLWVECIDCLVRVVCLDWLGFDKDKMEGKVRRV